MEKSNDPESVSSLRDQLTGLDSHTIESDKSTVGGRTYQLEFYGATNRRIRSPKAIQASSGKVNKQPVRRIQKMDTRRK